jgi:hypothetical protein
MHRPPRMHARHPRTHSFEWCTCDLSKDSTCKEVYDLLSLNYVEDDDNMFRFNYSPEFLKCVCLDPLGLRVAGNRLVATAPHNFGLTIV